MNSQRPVEIALAVVQHADRVLIGQRPDGVPLAGYWEFPGGKIQPGESPETAAARECLEETGLSIRLGTLLGVVEHEYDHARVRLHAFAAEPLEPSKAPLTPFRWIAIEDLIRYQFPPANKRILPWITAKPARDDAQHGH